MSNPTPSPSPSLSGHVAFFVCLAAALAMAAGLHHLLGTPWTPDGPAGEVVDAWAADPDGEPNRLSHRIQVRPDDGTELVIVRGARTEADACRTGDRYPECVP